jgi:hypothetical protein
VSDHATISRFSVAGIPFLHDGEVGIPLPRWIAPEWTGSRVTEEPIRIHHAIGHTTTDGLVPVIATDLPQGEYYVDHDQNMVIRARGAGAAVDRPQMLRTQRGGFEYTIQYESASDALRMQWGWHRTIFMFAMPMRRHGLSVHATAAILRGMDGILCPGISGAGKSTLAKTLLTVGSPDLEVIGDDRIAVTTGGAGLRVWGTPWHSSAGTSVAADAALRAVVFMSRGPGAVLAPVTPGSAARRLLRTVAIPFWDRGATAFALELIDRIVSSLPVFEFSYTPTVNAGAALVEQLTQALPTRNFEGC